MRRMQIVARDVETHLSRTTAPIHHSGAVEQLDCRRATAWYDA